MPIKISQAKKNYRKVPKALPQRYNKKVGTKTLSKTTQKRRLAKYVRGQGYETRLGAVVTSEYEALDYLMLQNGYYLKKQNGQRMKYNFRRI